VDVATRAFIEALPLIWSPELQAQSPLQLCDANDGTWGQVLASPSLSPTRERAGISEHGIWNQPIAGAAIPPGDCHV